MGVKLFHLARGKLTMQLMKLKHLCSPCHMFCKICKCNIFELQSVKCYTGVSCSSLKKYFVIFLDFTKFIVFSVF